MAKKTTVRSGKTMSQPTKGAYKRKTKKKLGDRPLPAQAATRAVDARPAAMERQQQALRQQGLRSMKRGKK